MSISVYNFGIVARRLLNFAAPGEFYIVEALCRPKKDGESTLGGSTNNHTRMVKMWAIYSEDDWDRLIEEMEKVCDANNARLYFLPQPRTTYSAMKSIMSAALANLDNEKVNFNRFLTSALCGLHDSPRKRWVLDIDWDDPVLSKWVRENEPEKAGTVMVEVDSAASKVLANVCERVVACGTGTAEDVVFLPTANGVHIVTPPFSPVANPKINLPPMPQPWNPDWLKKDAMTLVYTPNHTSEEQDS